MCINQINFILNLIVDALVIETFKTCINIISSCFVNFVYQVVLLNQSCRPDFQIFVF